MDVSVYNNSEVVLWMTSFLDPMWSKNPAVDISPLRSRCPRHPLAFLGNVSFLSSGLKLIS